MIVVSVRALLGIVAALLLAVLLEWTLPGGGNDAAQVAALRLVRGSPQGSSKMPLAERAAANWAESILARPLFSASRRPPRVAAGTQNDVAPDEARLSGIMIGRFGRRAIFAPSGGGKPLVLAEGAQVNESTIRSIDPDKVVLASGTVLIPAFDKNRAPTIYTPPFQPPVPNFPNPAFVNGNIPNAGFALPRMPQPPQLPQQQQEAEPGQPGSADGQPVPGAPVFHGPIIPNRRE